MRPPPHPPRPGPSIPPAPGAPTFASAQAQNGRHLLPALPARREGGGGGRELGRESAEPRCPPPRPPPGLSHGPRSPPARAPGRLAVLRRGPERHKGRHVTPRPAAILSPASWNGPGAAAAQRRGPALPRGSTRWRCRAGPRRRGRQEVVAAAAGARVGPGRAGGGGRERCGRGRPRREALSPRTCRRGRNGKGSVCLLEGSRVPRDARGLSEAELSLRGACARGTCRLPRSAAVPEGLGAYTASVPAARRDVAPGYCTAGCPAQVFLLALPVVLCVFLSFSYSRFSPSAHEVQRAGAAAPPAGLRSVRSTDVTTLCPCSSVCCQAAIRCEVLCFQM